MTALERIISETPAENLGVIPDAYPESTVEGVLEAFSAVMEHLHPPNPERTRLRRDKSEANRRD